MRFCIYFLQRVLLYFLEMAGQFNQSANVATTATKKILFWICQTERTAYYQTGHPSKQGSVKRNAVLSLAEMMQYIWEQLDQSNQ